MYNIIVFAARRECMRRWGKWRCEHRSQCLMRWAGGRGREYRDALLVIERYTYFRATVAAVRSRTLEQLALRTLERRTLERRTLRMLEQPLAERRTENGSPPVQPLAVPARRVSLMV